MSTARATQTLTRFTRRDVLRNSVGYLGLSLPTLLQLQHGARATTPALPKNGQAKACIVLFCWGGMSHIDTWDLKPEAPAEIRGQFKGIDTATPGIRITEHLPRIAKLTDQLAIVRSIHHNCSAHGKGMYWNLTGHQPPQPQTAANLPPSRDDWPSLGSVVGKLRPTERGMPSTISLPYPLVDNGTLQAGENAGWLGSTHDPIVVRTPAGKPWSGVSRDLGSPVFGVGDSKAREQLQTRRQLLEKLSTPDATRSSKTFGHFHDLALDMLLRPHVREAFDLDREPAKVREIYGEHLCGQSALLARRLVEAGVPFVTVVCAAGDLNGSKGDHWDTHAKNFDRLKNTMLPTFDRAASALLEDLRQRGRLDDTLVVMMGDFGRTPKVNKSAGRDHYPFSYSVVLAGGGIRGGQVYGSSDRQGAFPDTSPCGPPDLHATIFEAMGISRHFQLFDSLGRPHAICDGQPLPLF